MSKKINWIAGVIGGILALMAVATFVIAVFRGFDDVTEATPQIHVYINNNDSIVNQLQMDVYHLTKLIEDMETDSVVVTVSKVKKESVQEE